MALRAKIMLSVVVVMSLVRWGTGCWSSGGGASQAVTEPEKNKCESNTCNNTGICQQDSSSEYSCICNYRFTGDTCQQNASTGSRHCGYTTIQPQFRARRSYSSLVGGLDAESGSWPWQVSLKIRGSHVCGGSLISTRWVVSAAHCFASNPNAGDWTVLAGIYRLNVASWSTRQTRRIKRIIKHQYFNHVFRFDNDIALLELSSPVVWTDAIKPVCLPEAGQEVPAGTECVISGFGYTEEGGVVSNTLQQAKVPMVARSTCIAQLVGNVITDGMLCAGYKEGGVGICQGDSGGPLVCEVEGRYVLIGITSASVGCARPEKPGVFAKTSFYSEWIKDKIHEVQ